MRATRKLFHLCHPILFVVLLNSSLGYNEGAQRRLQIPVLPKHLETGLRSTAEVELEGGGPTASFG